MGRARLLERARLRPLAHRRVLARPDAVAAARPEGRGDRREGRPEDHQQGQTDENRGEASPGAARGRSLAARDGRRGRRRIELQRLVWGCVYRLTVRPDEALREGPRGERPEIVGFQRIEKAPVDAGRLGDLIEGDAVSLPKRTQMTSG